jgi:hypothetical protein
MANGGDLAFAPVDDLKRPISVRSNKVSSKKPKGIMETPKREIGQGEKLTTSGMRAL